VLRRLTERVRRALSAPGEELGRWGRFLQYQARLWRFCLRRLGQNNAAAMSAALSFRTIFALVPIIVLAIVVGKSLGLLAMGKEALRTALDRSGFAQIVAVSTHPGGTGEAASAPAASGKVVNVADEVIAIVDRVESKLTLGTVGPVGVALLIWTALTLLTTMENSLNRVFGAPRSRSTARRIMLYWSVMTLSPPLLAVAAYASDRAVDFLQTAGGGLLAWAVGILGWVQPLLVGVLVLAAVYALMPNTRVRFKMALGGAAVAFPLWLVAKWAFALYVRKVVGHDPLYGSLGLIPLFLMWLNLSWLLFLFGAEMAHAAQNLGRLMSAEQAEGKVLGTWDLLAAAVAAGRRYAAGQGPATVGQLASDLRLPAQAASALAERLRAAGLLLSMDGRGETGYVPARTLETIRAADVLDIGGQREAGAARPEEPIARAVERMRAAAGEALQNATLAELVKGGQ